MIASNGAVAGNSGVRRSQLIGLALGLGCTAAGTASYLLMTSVQHTPASLSYRLHLEAVRPPGEVVLSAWDDGDVIADHAPSDGHVASYSRTYTAVDHCTWKTIEELTPTSATTYAYRYMEYPVSCGPGGKPWCTPSLFTGLVNVAALRSVSAATPLTSVASDENVERALEFARATVEVPLDQ